MSDTPAIAPTPVPERPARPVSLFAIVFLFVLFALFVFIVRHFYQPVTALPQTVEPENLPKELAWRATRETRRTTLADLKKEQAQKLESYGWVDQKAGIVRLPIERAMELTVDKYAHQTQVRRIRDLPEQKAQR
jgi:predicted Holliday junction resolvase-like endonuclease